MISNNIDTHCKNGEPAKQAKQAKLMLALDLALVASARRCLLTLLMPTSSAQHVGRDIKLPCAKKVFPPNIKGVD